MRDPNTGVRDGRTLLDVVITARRWTAEECVRHFADAAIAAGEQATLSTAQLKRWRRGRLVGLPRPTACRVAERLFGYPAEELFAPAPTGRVIVSGDAVDSGIRVEAEPESRRPVPPPEPVPAMGACPDAATFSWITSVAHDASKHAAEAGLAVEEATLEQLHAEVVRLAHTQSVTPSLAWFAELVRARDLTYRMLERTRRPAQAGDLYLVAGQLSGLLAGVCLDLGHPDAATEQARAAFVYGQVIGHNTLRAWAQAALSTISFWSGRSQQGVAHAMEGLTYVDGGQTAIRLHAVAARSWALSGARAQALDALRAAEDERQRRDETDCLADGVCGEFAFGPARQEMSAGSTMLALKRGADAAVHAQATLDLYDAMPSQHQRTAGIHGARVDLSIARVMGSQLDAVADVLAPTLALQPERCTERITARLGILRDHLAEPRFRGAAQAGLLISQIEELLAQTTTRRALPSGP